MKWTPEIDARIRELSESGVYVRIIAEIVSKEFDRPITKGLVSGRRRSLKMQINRQVRDARMSAWHADARALYASGKSKQEIAAIFGRTLGHVSDLLKGDTTVSRGINPTQESTLIRRHVPRTIRKILPDNRVELCRLLVAGQITRAELSRQLWGGA